MSEPITLRQEAADWIKYGTEYRWDDKLMTFLRNVEVALAAHPAEEPPGLRETGLEYRMLAELLAYEGHEEEWEDWSEETRQTYRDTAKRFALASLSALPAREEPGPTIAHTVGENDLLFKRLGICGSEHTRETDQLCEVIRARDDELARLHRNVQGKRYVDMTPDAGMIGRILSAYIDESTLTDNAFGLPPDNPLCKAMNEAQAKRNELLRAALQAPAPSAPPGDLREKGIEAILDVATECEGEDDSSVVAGKVFDALLALFGKGGTP